MNLNSIIHFYYIAQFKNLSEAANHLNLTASAMTQSLKKLEDVLGKKLCIRSKGLFKLTPDGERLRTFAEKMHHNYDEVFNSVLTNENYNDVFSIAVLCDLKSKVFSESLVQLSREFPSIYLDIQAMPSEQICEKLKNQELDIAFTTTRTRDAELTYVAIEEETFSFYISKNHPQWSQKNIKSFKAIRMDVDHHTKSEIKTYFMNDPDDKSLSQAGFAYSLSAALHILESGHAAVPIPDWYLPFLKTRFKIKKLDLSFKINKNYVYMIYNPKKKNNRALDFLIETVIVSIKT